MLLSEFDQKLLQEWDYEKNNKLNIFPDKITYRSGKKVWWKCENNHSWITTINSRTGRDKSGCPYCANKKVLKGYNDLLSNFPDICKEWNYEKNVIKPDEITSGANKKVWWKCKNNHSYESVVANKTNQTRDCPYCSNRKVLKDYNDLLSNFPDICQEWDYELNTIKPDEITKYSNKEVYWKCNKGHSWKTIVYNRTKNKSGCPKCNNNKTSFGEQCIYYYLLPYNAKNRFKLDNMEIDIYLPEMNIESNKIMPVGIEFNGEYWHRDKKEKDLIKELKLSHKVTMYYICESTKNEIKGNKIFFNKEKYNLHLEWAIKTLFNILNLNIDVNIERDEQLIYKNLVKEEKENSLAFKHPELVKEWDYDKNTISPEQIVSGSHKKVYWKCKNNHSWLTTIKSRVEGTGCPYCRGRLAIKGENDLLSNFPDICEEWDYELNFSEYGLKPDEITKYSNKEVYWKCNQGHSWQTPVYGRTKNKAGCPYCNGNKVLKGYNDLLSNFPDIAKEWDYELNFSEYRLRPDEIAKGAHKKVYWKCKNNHSWLAAVYSRTSTSKSGCPYCAKKRSAKN